MRYLSPLVILLIASLLCIISCEGITDGDNDLDRSLDPIEDVTPVENANQVNITVNRTDSAYFRIDFQNIGENSVISNGEYESWCIDWNIPINPDGGEYSDVVIYSTENVRGWERLNYLFNIKDDLLHEMDITYREIQPSIWSLTGFPEFNLREVDLDDVPSRMRSGGEPAFSYEKVDEILSIVENGYSEFEYESGVLFAVIGETPADVQTVIGVVEKR